MTTTPTDIQTLTRYLNKELVDMEVKYFSIFQNEQEKQESDILYAKINELSRVKAALPASSRGQHDDILEPSETLVMQGISQDVLIRYKYAYKLLSRGKSVFPTVENYLTGQRDALEPVVKILSDLGYPRSFKDLEKSLIPTVR